MSARRRPIDVRQQASEVIEREKVEKVPWKFQRLQGLRLALEGQDGYRRIAAIVRVTTATLNQWINWYREGGVEGLLARPVGAEGGKAPRFSPQEWSASGSSSPKASGGRRSAELDAAVRGDVRPPANDHARRRALLKIRPARDRDRRARHKAGRPQRTVRQRAVDPATRAVRGHGARPFIQAPAPEQPRRHLDFQVLVVHDFLR